MPYKSHENPVYELIAEFYEGTVSADDLRKLREVFDNYSTEPNGEMEYLVKELSDSGRWNDRDTVTLNSKRVPVFKWLIDGALKNNHEIAAVTAFLSGVDANSRRQWLLYMRGLRQGDSETLGMPWFSPRNGVDGELSSIIFEQAVKVAALLGCSISVLIDKGAPAPRREALWYCYVSGAKYQTGWVGRTEFQMWSETIGTETVGITALSLGREFAEITVTADVTVTEDWGQWLRDFGEKSGLRGPSFFVDDVPMVYAGRERIYRMMWVGRNLKLFATRSLDKLKPKTRTLLYSKIFAPSVREVSVYAADSIETVKLLQRRDRKARVLQMLKNDISLRNGNKGSSGA